MRETPTMRDSSSSMLSTRKPWKLHARAQQAQRGAAVSRWRPAGGWTASCSGAALGAKGRAECNAC